MTRGVRPVAVLALLLASAWPLQAARVSFEEQLANLKSPNAKTREQAAGELGKSRRREAVAPLAALVRDPEVKVRLAVVRALRELRDLDGVPALVTSLGDGEPKIREEAVSSLVEIYTDRERSGPVGRFLGLFSDEEPRATVSVPVDPSVIDGLAGLLQDEERDLRLEAAQAIGILGGRGAVDRLLQALSDPDASVRAAVVGALEKVGTAEEGKRLIPLLADEPEVRDRAIRAIGTLRVKEAGPALRELWESSRKREDAERILTAISRIGDPEQAPFLRSLVQDPNQTFRRLAIEGLARVAAEDQITAFKKDFQREHSEELRLAYAFAIVRLGDPAFLDTLVLSLPSGTLGKRSAEYLVELGPGILPQLYPYLADPDAEIRARLADVMAALGDPAAIPYLEPLLQDPSTRVSDAVNRAVELLRHRASGAAER
jgi:HEAT repeat protein